MTVGVPLGPDGATTLTVVSSMTVAFWGTAAFRHAYGSSTALNLLRWRSAAPETWTHPEQSGEFAVRATLGCLFAVMAGG